MFGVKQRDVQSCERGHDSVTSSFEAIQARSISQKGKKRVEEKGGKCIICGYNKCISSLDFHHKNPQEKEFGINECISYSYERLLKEVDKCELVCRNCHGEINEDLIKI